MRVHSGGRSRRISAIAALEAAPGAWMQAHLPEPPEVALAIPEGTEPAQVALRVRLAGQRTWSTTQVLQASASTVRLSLESLGPGRHEAKLVAWIPGLPSLVMVRLPVLRRA